MAKHSFNTLIRRLSRVGFKKEFVTAALLPDWWEESYARDPDVLPEIEVRVARFLDVPISNVRNPESALVLPSYGTAQMRRVRDIDRDRLGPAIHSAIRLSQAVIRNLRLPGVIEAPIADPLEWRGILQSGANGTVQLGDILRDLWNKGIPVIPLDVLPTPSFQGLAYIVDAHPVIVLGHRYDEPGRVAFLVAHETGHILAGDCSPGTPVLDENEAVQDESAMEYAADRFARRLLVGDATVTISEETGADAKVIAQQAIDLESQTGVDASSMIYAWASKTRNYSAATMAVKALYRSTGARKQVREIFDEYVDLGCAGDSDLDLLRCVYGQPSLTALAG